MVLCAQNSTGKRHHVVVLGTGGTISGKCASPVIGGSYYEAGKTTIADMLDAIPEIQKIASVSAEQAANIPSHAVSAELWLKLARRCNALLATPEVDGIVITHGTDTLEETAYFLNLTVKSKKPVVLVGSMRPGNALSADGPLNLVDAVAVAANPQSIGKGVLVVLNGKISGARDVTKTSTLAVDTFNSRDLGYLGYVVENRPEFYLASTKCHTAASMFETGTLEFFPAVSILYGYAGQDATLAEAAIQSSSGIIHAGTGNGSMPVQVQALLEYAAKEKGIPVVRTSRTGSGMITRKPAFAASPFIRGNNLSPQKARILLMLALGKTKSLDEIQRIFDTY